LFDIAVEGLTILFKRALAIEYFKGIDYGNGIYLSHLQYADDALVFVPNDYNSLLHVKRILRWFELVSVLRVNFYKSSLVGINLDEEFTTGLASTIYCKLNTLPLTYLRLPLGAVLIGQDFQLGNLSSIK